MTTPHSRLRPRCRRHLLARRLGASLVALVIVLMPLTAQRPTATASGGLQACSGSHGGPIPPTGVTVGGICTGPFSNPGNASVSASCSETGFSLSGSGGWSSWYSGNYTMGANATVLVQAPAGANLQLQLTHQSSLSVQPGTSAAGSGSITVTIPGQTYTRATGTNSSGTATWPVVMPAAGLAINISYSESVSGGAPFGPGQFNSSTALAITWTYPGVTNAGGPSPGCLGAADGWTNGSPVLGASNFGFSCLNAHPNSGGLFALGVGGLSVPFTVGGINVWIDAAMPYTTKFRQTNAAGEAFYGLPIPNIGTMLGLTLFCQYLLLEPPGCMPLNLSAANAVRIVVQP